MLSVRAIYLRQLEMPGRKVWSCECLLLLGCRQDICAATDARQESVAMRMSVALGCGQDSCTVTDARQGSVAMQVFVASWVRTGQLCS